MRIPAGSIATQRDRVMPFPVDIKYVNDCEQKLGVKFPPAFTVRMVKENGGNVLTGVDSWELYPFFDTSDKKRLKRTCNDIVRETASARGWPDFPEKAIAIGANGCGDQLVLLRQHDAPELLAHEVYWWDHETGDLFKVADDFSELTT